MAEKDSAGAKQVTLAPPWLSEAFQVEHSIHRPSRLLLKDIEIVFRPDLEAEYERKKAAAAAGAQITGIEEKEAFLRANLLAVPTWQPAQQDLSEISELILVDAPLGGLAATDPAGWEIARNRRPEIYGS